MIYAKFKINMPTCCMCLCILQKGRCGAVQKNIKSWQMRTRLYSDYPEFTVQRNIYQRNVILTPSVTTSF